MIPSGTISLIEHLRLCSSPPHECLESKERVLATQPFLAEFIDQCVRGTLDAISRGQMEARHGADLGEELLLKAIPPQPRGWRNRRMPIVRIAESGRHDALGLSS